MPFDASRYPEDWREISRRIRDRSGGQCECAGQCGHPHPDPALFIREGIQPLKRTRCPELNGKPAQCFRGRVVLTVAHLGVPRLDGSPGDPTDKMDVRPENLAAMCQACHLRYDSAEHTASRRKRRAAEREKIEPSLPL